MKIYNFHNGKLRNNFNPQYSFYLAEDSLDLNTDTMAQLLLNKEKEFLNKYPSFTDGGTGLGNQSITSRFYYYNLLQIPETKFLKKHIRKTHDKFLMNLGYKIETNYYAQCWFNVMRKGDQIKPHRHAPTNFKENCYLCGHFNAQVDGTTSTFYKLNDHVEEMKNISGNITFFPSYVSHWTNLYNGNSQRITCAFDIKSKEFFEFDTYLDARSKWVKLE